MSKSVASSDFAISCLPDDWRDAKLIGRVWSDAGIGGPSVVIVENGQLFDVTAYAATVSDVLNHRDPPALWRELPRELALGSVERPLASSRATRSESQGPRMLAPCDIQAVKACGVTFVRSLLERVIEERALGSPESAKVIRAQFEQTLGATLENVVPGSPQALRLKEELLAMGLWSQYLEVGIGPDAEVFTKAQPLSAVGFGHRIGVLPDSHWNNPEPELVLAVAASGRIVGSTLGNDVNLRDYEGRSALLLGRAKDNNASCAIGPFIRLLDEKFTLAQVRNLELSLDVIGSDGFTESGVSNMGRISRDIEDLVGQAMGAHHQYPDGMMLFTGTMFTPITPRAGFASGFGHQPGDLVRVHCDRLGTLENTVDHTDAIEPWTFGITALMRNLSARGYL